MGGAKLVGTSGIGYVDGAVCKVTDTEGNVTKYNDYIALHTGGGVFKPYKIGWHMAKDSVKTVTLLPIEFDYIVLQPDFMNRTIYDHYQYNNQSSQSSMYHATVNPTIGNLPSDYSMIIHDKNSITAHILLQSNYQASPNYAASALAMFTLSVDSLTHRLTITANNNLTYIYNEDGSNDGSTNKQGVWIPDTIREGTSAMIGPCLGIYTILYYKY